MASSEPPPERPELQEQRQAPSETSATTQVLRLPELLEQILTDLPPKDLLLAQRTCLSFRSTTTNSLRLQRALFLAPDWRLENRLFNPYSSYNRPGRKPQNNRLLLRAFPGNYPTISLVVASASPPSSSSTEVEAQGSSEEEEPDRPPQTRRPSDQWTWEVCISFPADEPPTPPHPSIAYPEASWRRMFLCQPPCTALHLVRRWQRSRRPAMVRNEGIRMGTFCELVKEGGDCEAGRAGGETGGGTGEGREGTKGRKWHRSYVSSDRDWHFEGELRCTSLEE